MHGKRNPGYIAFSKKLTSAQILPVGKKFYDWPIIEE